MPLLRVKVVSASKLLALDSNILGGGGPSSDPYVRVTCGTETSKTKEVKKSLNPQWHEEFRFGESVLLDLSTTSLHFRVKDHNVLGPAEDLGEVTVALEPLLPNQWNKLTLPLETHRSMKKAATGDLVVEVFVDLMQGVGTAPPLLNKVASMSEDPASLDGPPALAEGGDGAAVAAPAAAWTYNVLAVSVLEGKGLKALDGTGADATSDPFVILSMGGSTVKPLKTKVIKKSLAPKWRQKFYFAIDPNTKYASTVLTLQCEDQDVFGTDFMGLLAIDVREWVEKFGGTKTDMWLSLGPNTKNPSRANLNEEEPTELGWGQLHVAIEPCTLECALDRLAQGETDSEVYAAGDGGESGSNGAVDETPENAKETDEEIKQREAEQKKMLEELQQVEFKNGDYQIQVRVIEVRDLVPQDANGSADPVVFVDCLGQSQHTSVKPNQLSCVFDHLMFFNLKDLDKEAVEGASIEVTVKDADGPFGVADKIGYFRIDVPYVYYQKNHEMYRQWVALVKSAGESEQGVQGYLLLSIAVLGPGDKYHIHDVTDVKEENEMVLMPPRLSQALHFLVVTVHRAEGLPNMDKTMVSKGGIDAYVKVQFAGEKPLTTRTVSTKGSDVEFQQELWFPVLLPCMSNLIKINVWDWDRGSDDELVATCRPYYFNQVKDHPTLFQRIWSNLYGAPEDSRLLQFNTKHKLDMNTRPDTASTYRGRVLLSLRVESEVKNTLEIPHTRNLLSTTPSPPTQNYALRAFVLSGTEIPAFASKMRFGQNSRMSVRVCCGSTTLWTSRVDNVKGLCHWNEFLEATNVALPSDLSQAPDVFVYLVHGAIGPVASNICYARYKAADVINSTGELPPIKWISLMEDDVLDNLADSTYTGSILLRLALEPMGASGRTEAAWNDLPNVKCPNASYSLLVHLFQGRGLPAADANGLLDPFVAVTCNGVGLKSSTKIKTRDPMYYETLVFDINIPTDRAHQPRIGLQVYDWDRWDKDDFVGGVAISLQDVDILSAGDYTNEYTVPKPRWYKLSYDEDGDGSEGELLVSCSLIAKDFPDQVIEPPSSIKPKMQEKFLEITCLGLRDLSPIGFMPLHMPFLQFDIGEVSSSNRPKKTGGSSKPTPQNPNFLERIIIPLQLPEDAQFAPRLNLSVFDTLLGGFHKPLLGTCSIDLTTKLPFSNGVENPLYVPPGECTKYNLGNPHVDGGPVVPMATTAPPAADDGTGLPPFLRTPSSAVPEIGPDDDEIPAYLKNRKVMAGTIEEDLQSTPFEVYEIFRGQKYGGPASTYHAVGKFKGLIRVIHSRSEPPLFDLKELLNPQPYVIRVYILDAFALQAKDQNGKSDPYLRLKLGNDTIVNDRARYIEATLNPKFHTLYEFKANLPGASELTIECFDYDLFSLSADCGDDFIGATKIDLEDRWFDDRWRTLGHLSEGTFRPVETRQLYTPSSVISQGSLRLWLDILTPSEATALPAVDISLPPIETFEVRVVIYKAKDVVPGDEFSEMSDLFAKCWMQSNTDKAQHTDVHWRAKNGKASFNWRMKFDIALPVDPQNERDKGHLHVQLWDKDMLFDDCLSDTIVNLTEPLKLAYKTKQLVNVYAKQKPVKVKSTTTTVKPMNQPSLFGAGPDVDLEGGESTALLTRGSSGSTSQRNVEKRQPKIEDKKESVDMMIKALKTRIGMGDDPEDATWLTCTTVDPHTKTRVEAGKLLLAIEIIPKAEAEIRAAGLGRSEPNAFPTLAEPADRLHLTALFNPLTLLESLLGPKAYGACSSFLFCALIIAFLVFAGPLVNVLLTLINMIPPPFGWIVFISLLSILVLGFCYCSYRCRRAISNVDKD
ncbi:hypothetical protein H310_09840 [Aphanomyces invadans]|uniref:C2 domain-containing protein n=1 Tax=Aphanomyces invadans TaxID=157072 RepID=A0A024TTP8_9STRA|nr:hypothetical protein H310_09840 [Aphanomyces invadans]ETV96991.1 hypothetical protein H310_09840 [Aphanomyces invadans]|eukprot:XP_008874237.1 hypothetical protein H310_09840 [Aphanomyces invadans]